jgi:hypothetical protein
VEILTEEPAFYARGMRGRDTSSMGIPSRVRGLRLAAGRAPRLALAAAFFVAMFAASAPAQSRPLPEYEVKAAFLYNFAKFVEWPAEALPASPAPFKLCVLGKDPFGTGLQQAVQRKTVGDRELKVMRLNEVRQTEGCHILFISSSERRQMRQILETLQWASILTVGETEDFGRLGGIINFTLEQDKIRFQINLDAAARARLKISSKLLALAKIIRDQHPAGGY